MKTKIRQLKVDSVIETGAFRVIQATDTIHHLPGSTVAAHVIERYCSDPTWKITVVHPSKD